MKSIMDALSFLLSLFVLFSSPPTLRDVLRQLTGADYYAVYQAEAGADLDDARAVLERRIQAMGLEDASVTVLEDSKIRLRLANQPDEAEARQLATQLFAQGLLTFEDESGQVLMEGQVATAQAAYLQSTGQPIVGIELTAEGARRFAEITGANLGKKISIVVDGSVLSAPTVNDHITDGKAYIDSTDWPVEDAQALAYTLQSGTLPCPFTEVEWGKE